MICGNCGKHFEFSSTASSCRTKGCPAFGLTFKQVDLSAFYTSITTPRQPDAFWGS